MNKKITIVIGLACLIPLLAIIFYVSGTNPHTDQDHAAHDHGGEAKGHAHGDPRLSAALRDPAFQEPAPEPLLTILSEEVLLEGPFMGARFAADGKHLIVTGEGYRGLWVALRDGSGLRQISDEPMAGWRPVTTKDGDLVYRTAQINEDGVLVGFTIIRHDLESGTEVVLYQGVNEDVYPPWLSKDENVLFIRRDGVVYAEPLRASAADIPLSDRDEGFAYSDGGQVWYHHVGLNESMPLSSDPEATGGEAASPDGAKIAYLSGNDDSVLIVDVRTGAEVNIGEGSNLSWSPDGRLLLYDVGNDDGYNVLDSAIFVVQSDGQNPQRVTFNDRPIHNPSWSPEGDSFVAEDVHTGEIYHFQVNVSNNPTQQ